MQIVHYLQDFSRSCNDEGENDFIWEESVHGRLSTGGDKANIDKSTSSEILYTFKMKSIVKTQSVNTNL